MPVGPIQDAARTAPPETTPTTTSSAAEAATSATPTGPALALRAATQLLVVVDASIVDDALPSIATALSIDQQITSWVINACVLVFAGGLLLGGRRGRALRRPSPLPTVYRCASVGSRRRRGWGSGRVALGIVRVRAAPVR